MNKNAIRNTVIASLAGAGLALGVGAGVAAAAPAETTTVPDGAYTLDVYSPLVGIVPNAGQVSMPARVEGGKLVVNGVALPVQLTEYVHDKDGDFAGVTLNGAGVGQIR